MNSKFIFISALMILYIGSINSAPVDNVAHVNEVTCKFHSKIPAVRSIIEKLNLGYQNACRSVAPSAESSSVRYVLCSQINNLFIETVCNGAPVESTIDSVPFPDNMNSCLPHKDDIFCRVFCEDNFDLCSFLVWINDVNIALKHSDGESANGINEAVPAPSTPEMQSNTAAIEGVQEEKGSTLIQDSGTTVTPLSISVQVRTTQPQATTTHNVSDTMLQTKSNDTVSQSGTALMSGSHTTGTSTTEIHSSTSSDITLNPVSKHSTSQQVDNSEMTNNLPNMENKSATKIIENNIQGDAKNKSLTKETEPSSLSATSKAASNDISSSTLTPKIEETIDGSNMGTTVEDGILDYNEIITDKTADEVKTSKLPDNKPQLDESTHFIKDTSSKADAFDIFDPLNKESGELLEAEDSHFFLYFLFAVGLVIGCYILFHNKQKILALIVEGRHERRRRPNTTSYKKLETK